MFLMSLGGLLKTLAKMSFGTVNGNNNDNNNTNNSNNNDNNDNNY